MKIIHLTDTHILGEGRENLYGINPAYRLKRAIKSINQSHTDAEFIAITGDLVDNASEDAYAVFKEIIKQSKIPVYSILGNHDNREKFLNFFPEYENDGFVQYVYETDGRVFLFIDTLIEGKRYGDLCSKRLKWLEKKLQKYKENPMYIFMHHHPVISGLYEMDHLAQFRSADSFWKMIEKFPSIKHISFGHLHRIMHASRAYVSMHSTRSTSFQVAYKINDKQEYTTDKEMPTYAVINISKTEDITIHHHEYLSENDYREYNPKEV